MVWVFSTAKLRQSAHPEQRFRFRKRARLRLGARDHEDGFLMQIDVHIPLVVSVVIAVEADNHVWQMAGLQLVVVVVGGVGFWVQNVVEANEGMKVVGCTCAGPGVSRPPAHARVGKPPCLPLKLYTHKRNILHSRQKLKH